MITSNIFYVPMHILGAETCFASKAGPGSQASQPCLRVMCSDAYIRPRNAADSVFCLQASRSRLEAAVQQSMQHNINHWGPAEVCDWAEYIGLGQYRKKFVHHCVDGRLLLRLRDKDLKARTHMGHPCAAAWHCMHVPNTVKGWCGACMHLCCFACKAAKLLVALILGCTLQLAAVMHYQLHRFEWQGLVQNVAL